MTKAGIGRGWRIPLVGVLLGIAGCGGDPYLADRAEVVPASGVITYAGQPVAGATVTFHPQETGKPGANGKTDAQGRFRLQTYGVDDGVVPGEHKVTVVLWEITAPTGNPDDPDYEPEDVPPPKSLVPEKYGNPRTSDLTATVAAGEQNEFPFELQD